MAEPFTTQKAAALALLNGGYALTRKSGSFLGQCIVDDTSLSIKQADWLATLLSKNGLPPLASGGDA